MTPLSIARAAASSLRVAAQGPVRTRRHREDLAYPGQTVVRKRPQPTMPADELYAVPLAEFTQKRNALAAQLRKDGHRDQAGAIKTLAKPNAAAWAINQLVRRQRRLVDEFLTSAAALRDAQIVGRGDVQALTRAERERLQRLVEAANDQLGGKPSADVLTRVRQTLEAAAVDEAAAEQVRTGRLGRELEPAGFGSLVSHPPAGPAKRPPRGQSQSDAAAQERARQALHDAEQRLRQATRTRNEKRSAVQDADRAVAAASARQEQARAALGQAERAMAAAEGQVAQARTVVAEPERP